MIGMTLPRRLMTPRTWAATCGTCVMSITLMISRTFSTGSPYSSCPSANARYLPASAETGGSSVPVGRRASVVSIDAYSFAPSGRRAEPVPIDQRHQSAGIENQSDSAVAENRAAGDAAHAAEHLPEPLDDD